LAQLVIKAISLLENIGVRIDGVVSDGASNNRKLWSEHGISGEKMHYPIHLNTPWMLSEKLSCFQMHLI